MQIVFLQNVRPEKTDDLGMLHNLLFQDVQSVWEECYKGGVNRQRLDSNNGILTFHISFHNQRPLHWEFLLTLWSISTFPEWGEEEGKGVILGNLQDYCQHSRVRAFMVEEFLFIWVLRNGCPQPFLIGWCDTWVVVNMVNSALLISSSGCQHFRHSNHPGNPGKVEFGNYSCGKNKPSESQNTVLSSSEYQFVHLYCHQGISIILYFPVYTVRLQQNKCWTFFVWNCDNLCVLHTWRNSSSPSLSVMWTEPLQTCTCSISHLL